MTITDAKKKTVRGMTEKYKTRSKRPSLRLENRSMTRSAKGWKRSERVGGFKARLRLRFSTIPVPPSTKVSK